MSGDLRRDGELDVGPPSDEPEGRTESLPRLLVLMGSGELAPTMVKVHRQVLNRLRTRTCVLLEAPFSFQENAGELAARAASYFRESLGATLLLASTGKPPTGQHDGDETGLAEDTVVRSLRSAGYVFSGPGSPSFALSQWRGSVVPAMLLEKLLGGGAVGLASAAALTVGAYTVPVYEIYKVGQPPHWLAGLDLLGAFGLRAAVVPHFNNAEGGTHDTRFCYLGERRLRAMEDQLPPDAFILGIDEHTSLLIDFDTGTATVGGIGSATARQRGETAIYPTGTTLQLADLPQRSSKHPTASAPAETAPAASGDIRAAEARFDVAIANQDPATAARALLALESSIAERQSAGSAPEGIARDRAGLRAMLLELGEVAANRANAPEKLVAPYVEALLELRQSCRTNGDFTRADAIRDVLVANGVELHDTATGTSWNLAD